MQGGRKSFLAKAFREHSLAELERQKCGDRPIPFERTLARLERGTLSRRQLLRYGGVLGAGLALASCTRKSSSGLNASRSTASSSTPHDARVVVVGAGLAGTTAAYRLSQAGVAAQLYEARDRIGGRCWTARGFADGQTAEHGGEFIDTRHVHIRQLARELGLKLDDLSKGYAGTFSPRYVNGSYLRHETVKPQMDRIRSRVTADAKLIGVIGSNGEASAKAYTFGSATPAAMKMDQLSMADWLEENVPDVMGSAVGKWLDEVMAGWYGLNLSDLSALNWMDYFLIPAPGADENWRVHGGNDQISTLTADRLRADSVHLQTPLRAIRRQTAGPYELTFDGVASPVIADLLILTLPFSTLRQVDLSGAGFGAQKMAAINDLAMGYDAKVLLQYDRRPHTMRSWSGLMESTEPDFDTWESSATEPGRSGLITVYAGGRTGAGWAADKPHGPSPRKLTDAMVDRIDQAVPGTAAHFNGRAWADLWPRDPWTNGAYAAFAVGQMTRFWGGTAQPDGNTHFAGEATSTYSQGYLNGGVESGERAAIEVLTKLGIPVPKALSDLPH